MTENKFPGPAKWIYKKWYFWVLVIIYSLWSEFESYINLSIGEIIGSLLACFLIVSLVFLFTYFIASSIAKHKSKN